MKQPLLFFILLISSVQLFAQRTGDVAIYSNTGKKFYVVLNGIRQNQDAETNVKVSSLSDSWYSCRVMAEDKSFSIEKNIGVKKDSLVTYRIIEKKGKYKLRFYSESSLGTAPQVQDQTTVVYHSSEQPQNTGNMNSYSSGSRSGGGTGGGNQNGTGGGNQNGGSNNQGTMTTTTTTTSTSVNTNNNSNTDNNNVSIGIHVDENGNMTTTGQSGSESINVGINVNENGAGANVSMSGNTGGTVTESSYEETVTTTTSTTTTVNGTTTYSEETTTVSSSGDNGSTYYEETTTSTSEGNIYTGSDMTATMNNGGCYTSDEDVTAIKAAMEKEAFDEDKMRIAQQMAKSKCMTVDQIRSVAEEFAFSDDRMTFIKSCYINCMNQQDYMLLSDLFNFSDDKAELERFINSK